MATGLEQLAIPTSGLSARCYSETSAFQRDSGYQFLQELFPLRGGRVLDLGCGTGYLASVLSESVGRDGKVIAVDPDEERLKFAQEKHARGNIEYMKGDAATFPVGPAYDLVFSNHVIHWVKDKDALLGRVYESLKPSGRFAFTTGDSTPEWPQAVNDCMSELFWPDVLDDLFCKRTTFPTCDQYRELAVSHGFVVTSIEAKDLPVYPIAGVNDVIDFFFGLLQGELDRAGISKQALQACRDKYDDALRCVAELRLKILHVVLTKP